MTFVLSMNSFKVFGMRRKSSLNKTNLMAFLKNKYFMLSLNMIIHFHAVLPVLKYGGKIIVLKLFL